MLYKKQSISQKGYQCCDATHGGANHQRQHKNAAKITQRLEESRQLETAGARIAFVVVLNGSARRKE